LIGIIAGIQSNRPAAQRHLQDNLFWAADGALSPWRRGPEPPSQARQSAGRPLRQAPKGGWRGKSGLHRHTVPD